jgi:hypothetical protein
VTPVVPGAPLTYNVARLLAEPPGSSRDYLVAGVMIDLDASDLQRDPIEVGSTSADNRGLIGR